MKIYALIFIGYWLGYFSHKLCQVDVAKKQGVLNIGGMKFVRWVEK